MLVEYLSVAKELLSVSVKFVRRLGPHIDIFGLYLLLSVNLYLTYGWPPFPFCDCSISVLTAVL